MNDDSITNWLEFLQNRLNFYETSQRLMITSGFSFIGINIALIGYLLSTEDITYSFYIMSILIFIAVNSAVISLAKINNRFKNRKRKIWTDPLIVDTKNRDNI